MGNFKKNSRSSGGRPRGQFGDKAPSHSYGRSKGPNILDTSTRFSIRDTRNRPGSGDSFAMHDAICAKCGKKCQVPFRPTSGKPIFCRDCYGRKDRDGPSQPPQSSDKLDEINGKLDKIMEALEID